MLRLEPRQFLHDASGASAWAPKDGMMNEQCSCTQGSSLAKRYVEYTTKILHYKEDISTISGQLIKALCMY